MNPQGQLRRLDAVEIKVTIGADGIKAAAEAFDLGHAEKRRRTIYFCEDPEGLPLLTAGIILRLRKNKGRRDDITVKLRPCNDSQLTQRWVSEHGSDGWEFRVEGDWAGTRRVTSASVEAKLEAGIIDAVVEEDRGVPLLPAQRAFLHDCAGASLDLSRLSPLGPVDGTKWDLNRNGQEISAEQWVVGDGLHFLEFSIRVRPDGALVAQERFGSLFRELGIAPDSAQETKTRRVLEYLAAGGGPR